MFSRMQRRRNARRVTRVCNVIWFFLCCVGIIATALFLGLLYGGFFTFMARKFPDNQLLQMLFGA